MLLVHPQSFRLLRFLVAFLLLSAGMRRTAQAQGSEYQIKAERICSFTRFVDWPSKRFLTPNSPFVIGVFGTDAISDLLREAIQNRRIKDRPVVIKHILSKHELAGCHVLFVSRSERDKLPSVLSEVRREGVLTVGETEDFLSRGGIINFVNAGGDIRFQVNLDAARRERLSISSKLLQLAIPASENPYKLEPAPFSNEPSIE